VAHKGGREVVSTTHRDIEVGGAPLVLDEPEGEGAVLVVVVAGLVFQSLALLAFGVDLVLQFFDAVSKGGGLGLVTEVCHVDRGAQSDGDIAEGVVGDILICGEGGEDGVRGERPSGDSIGAGGVARVGVHRVIDVGEVVGSLGLDGDGGGGVRHVKFEEGDE
jgi:hypothetical protein